MLARMSCALTVVSDCSGAEGFFLAIQALLGKQDRCFQKGALGNWDGQDLCNLLKCWNISMHSFGILKKLFVAKNRMLWSNPTLKAALVSCCEHSVAALKFLILNLKPQKNLRCKMISCLLFIGVGLLVLLKNLFYCCWFVVAFRFMPLGRRLNQTPCCWVHLRLYMDMNGERAFDSCFHCLAYTCGFPCQPNLDEIVGTFWKMLCRSFSNCLFAVIAQPANAESKVFKLAAVLPVLQRA